MAQEARGRDGDGEEEARGGGRQGLRLGSERPGVRPGRRRGDEADEDGERAPPPPPLDAALGRRHGAHDHARACR